jgi:hypothetical protein
MRRVAMSGREVEMTFSVDLADVESVHRVIATPSASAGQGFRISPMPPRAVLHFYLPSDGGAQVHRLRVRRRDGQVVIKLEAKQVVREAAMLIVREETTICSRVSIDHARQILSRDEAIISSFIKIQHRARLKSDFGILKVSLDQMLPFKADQPMPLVQEFWHLEIEEVRGWPLPEFLNSPFFRRSLPALRPLRTSKWQLSKISPPTSISTKSVRHFGDYLITLLDEGERQTNRFTRACCGAGCQSGAHNAFPRK